MITLTCGKGHVIQTKDVSTISTRCSVCGDLRVKFNKKVKRTCLTHECNYVDVVPQNKFVDAHHFRGHNIYRIEAFPVEVEKKINVEKKTIKRRKVKK